MTLLLVMTGGAVGAVLRYLVDRVVVGAGRPSYWGTFAVNVVGAALLGGIAGTGTALDGPLARLLATGLCGALTTYSTFAYEVVQLAGGGARDRWRAAGYAAATLTVGFTALVTAHAMAAALAR
ncbi:CrcB family protein [Solwaraspora sp. WMMA2056]|uniref:fluoride efflux transporter FluC n=1 Tax=Solwaraspora sp. WMMA2056 TaxID=3015161 RepID=UPI00259B42E1|nr:CrcB family protein [Solwaraspora sp. WMMA2056]WJK41785.1 CrcB family protein [Solwaraspora sp. WMMA2056]